MTLTLIGLVRGGLTAILCAAFIALWVWAWSKQRKADFDAAARLPFEEAVSKGEQAGCSADCSSSASDQPLTANR